MMTQGATAAMDASVLDVIVVTDVITPAQLALAHQPRWPRDAIEKVKTTLLPVRHRRVVIWIIVVFCV